METLENSGKNSADIEVGCLIAVYAFWFPKSWLNRWLEKVLKEHNGESYLSALLRYVIGKLKEEHDRFLSLKSPRRTEGFPNSDTSLALADCISAIKALGYEEYLKEVRNQTDQELQGLQGNRLYLADLFGDNLWEAIALSYWQAMHSTPSVRREHFLTRESAVRCEGQHKDAHDALVEAWRIYYNDFAE